MNSFEYLVFVSSFLYLTVDLLYHFAGKPRLQNLVSSPSQEMVSVLFPLVDCLLWQSVFTIYIDGFSNTPNYPPFIYFYQCCASLVKHLVVFCFFRFLIFFCVHYYWCVCYWYSKFSYACLLGLCSLLAMVYIEANQIFFRLASILYQIKYPITYICLAWSSTVISHRLCYKPPILLQTAAAASNPQHCYI